MAKDLVLGCFDWYNFDVLAPWVKSLKATGFSGDIVVIAFNATFQTVNQLVAEGCKVIACERDDQQQMYLHKSKIPVHVERFFHYFNFLKEYASDYRYVLATDMRDIVFQHNPFDFISDIFRDYPELNSIASSESIKYKDEPWGNSNLEQCFGPYFHDYFKHREIYNVGVLAGGTYYMRDLFLNIFLMSTNRPTPIVDQAVYNAMMYVQPYANRRWHSIMDDAFAVHLGTTMDPTKIDQFRPFLLEQEPKLDPVYHHDPAIGLVDLEVVNSKGEPFSIVHQWDRVPELKDYYTKKYGVN